MGCWLISQRERLLSKDHLNTLINIHTLARMLFTNEQCRETLVLYQRAYLGSRELLEHEHDDTEELLAD
jgi:hypothetical protein